MTENAFIAIKSMLSIIWYFMTQKVPGFNFTFTTLFCGAIFIPIVFKFINNILGMSGNSTEIGATVKSYSNYTSIGKGKK